MKNKGKTLLHSVIALILCLSLLVGGTFAWFTDSAESGYNTITAGNLDVELYHSNAAVRDEQVDEDTPLFLDLQGNPIRWEPGVVSYENLRVSNAGTLALVYQLTVNAENENFIVDPSGARYGLSQALKVGFVEGGITATDRQGVLDSVKETDWTTLADFLREGSLMPVGAGDSEKTWGIVIYWQPSDDDDRWNLNNGKQLNEGDELSIDLGIKLVATQEMHESDTFGDDYDKPAKGDNTTTNNNSGSNSGSGSGNDSGNTAPEFPEFDGGSAGTPVESDADGKVTAEVTLSDGTVSAVVPVGVQLEDGTTHLELTVSAMGTSGANVELGDGEAIHSVDVHISGVSGDNETPITVTLRGAAAKGLNMGNYKVYHVEADGTKEMTLMGAAEAFTAHNQFKYDPATGDLTLYMASFSEVAVVAEPAAWEGVRDYSWYDASATELTIANADQLAAFGAIVGGMDGKTADSFAGKTVKLINDINIGDITDEDGRKLMFYPIGYYNTYGGYERIAGVEVSSGFKNFEGIFDGDGHAVSNFYQNTWEAFGDYNDGYSGTPNYNRDGFGLFGRVYKGTVKNLTVKNFSSDGEFATTGTIAAYADGATFENIAIFDCNPRVYNIGNGGIVGCVGWYAKDANLKTTFRNITVDNSNKITALWGSWDVACGGIVGQYYPTSGQTSANKPANGGIHFENCHVSAQIDVYNDVCANYQYYAYRYAGILMGSVRENVTIDGSVYPKMNGITASGCTVHFGDWNDYYYCELVANSLASYTHDHQMSRLEQVAKVDGNVVTHLDGKTETVTGTRNFVVVKAKDDKGMWIHGDGKDYATCYHFVNGAVWTHDMAGMEEVDTNGDGVKESVLKEDKQCIYREFNNLVTGYGWGVTSKGVEDMAGVTILDREVADSVVKFGVQSVNEVESYTAIKLGDLFTLKNSGVELKNEALTVTVTDLDHTDGIVTGTFTKGATWADSTITVNGKGAISVTIQDYYFCVPTTITLTAIDPIQSLTVDATTLYEAGQPFNVISAVVDYKYGETRELTADEYTVGAYNFSVGGLKEVTVSYTEFGHTVTNTVPVEVVDAFNGLVVSPKKSTYDIGYAFTAEDFHVTAVDSNGRPRAISGYEIGAIDSSTTGKKTVTASVKNPTTNKVTSGTCEVLVFILQNISDEVEQYWFFEGNFNVSGWANVVHGEEHNYKSYVGQTYNAPNGEIVTGFDVSWADPATTPNNGATGAGQTAHMSEGQYDLVIHDAVPYTTLGINCIAGYSEELIGFGYYVDGDLSTLQFNAPAIIYDETNCGGKDTAGYTLLDYVGKNNGHSLLEMNCNNFAPGSTHTVYWVAVFADGVKNISEWTVHMKVADQSSAVFVDTVKPNANVIIMAGQSNMFGASPITQTIRDKYENHNFSNVYIHYNNINFNVNPDGTVASTLQTYFSNTGFQKYQLGIGGQANTYFGPEAALAYNLSTNEAFKNEQWYIIKYAAAGTGLSAHWLSACNVNGKATTLTDDMLAYVQETITGLEADGFDVKIHSFMWMQGESDAIDKTWAQNYAANEKALVSRVRNAFAGNATRYAGDPSVPGGGMAFINGGIASNDTDNTTANGGPNDWIWAEIVNAGKIGNCQQLCSVPGHNAALVGEALKTGPLAGNMFVVVMNGEAVTTPTIVNPNLQDTIPNSIFLDTHYLLSKLNSTNEHSDYVGNDATDWAHYGAASMDVLGELFASGNHFMMVTGPVMSAKYTVTYDANGGSASSDGATVNAGESVTLPTPTREGYTFKGWYTAASGGDKVGDAGATYTPNGSVALYAQWEINSYTIKVTTSNATVKVNGTKVNNNGTVSIPYGEKVTVDVTYSEQDKQSTTITGTDGTTYTSPFTMPAQNVTINATSEDNSCFAPDTLIMLSDGTQKRVDELTFADKLLAWDFFTGTYVEKDISLLVNHGEAFYTVNNLCFSDGTVLRTIGEHGVFDYDLNEFVYLTMDNMASYIGHRFVQYAADGSYNIVVLDDAYASEEYTSAWSVTTAGTSNAFASGMLTVAPPKDFYNWIEMGGKLTYDVEQFQKDVETYGLYTYDDFKDYVTYEQFVAWNGAYLKVAVEKGYFTFDYILELIELYKGWMPAN